jgi:hypothetical protein
MSWSPYRRRSTGARDAAAHDRGAERDAERGGTPLLTDWRRSAQRVTRAWNAWIAADERDRDACYREYAAALAAEELAAARMERTAGSDRFQPSS